MTSQLGESNKRLEDYAGNLKGMVDEKTKEIERCLMNLDIRIKRWNRLSM